jgi:hypothetical protein
LCPAGAHAAIARRILPEADACARWLCIAAEQPAALLQYSDPSSPDRIDQRRLAITGIVPTFANDGHSVIDGEDADRGYLDPQFLE